ISNLPANRAWTVGRCWKGTCSSLRHRCYFVDVTMDQVFARTGRSAQPEPTFVIASPQMTALVALAERAGASDAKVLITGESGVGKDRIARLIHERSLRKASPFIAVNCAGLTETLLESELFGHVKGSFTGAYRDKPGKLQIAHRGTLFLDEVGEMSLR